MEFSFSDRRHISVRFEACDTRVEREQTVRALGYSCADGANIRRDQAGNIVEATLAGDTNPSAAIELVQAVLHSTDISAPSEAAVSAQVDLYEDGLPFVFGSHDLT